MSKDFVLDASPIIIMAKIGLIELIPKVADELIIPKAVKNEIEAGIPNDPAFNWIKSSGKVFIRDVGSIEPEILKWDLGLGETEVLSFAYKNKGFTAILDDRAARRCARALGIKIKGTLSLLILAKKEGYIPRISLVLDKLIKAGFYVSSDLIQKAKDLANE